MICLDTVQVTLHGLGPLNGLARRTVKNPLIQNLRKVSDIVFKSRSVWFIFLFCNMLDLFDTKGYSESNEVRITFELHLSDLMQDLSNLMQFTSNSTISGFHTES